MNEELSRPSQLLQCRLDSSVNVWLIRCVLLTFSAGHVQTADSSLLSASAFSLPSLCIERAKWMASQVTHQIGPFYQKGYSLHIAGLQSSSLLSSKNGREVHNTLSVRNCLMKNSIRDRGAVLRNFASNHFSDSCNLKQFCRKWKWIPQLRISVSIANLFSQCLERCPILHFKFYYWITVVFYMFVLSLRFLWIFFTLSRLWIISRSGWSRGKH